MEFSDNYVYKGYSVYFTAKCIVEVFHVHASKKKRIGGAAKFWVYEDGSSEIVKTGRTNAAAIP